MQYVLESVEMMIIVTLIICSDVRREDKVVPGLVAFTCPELLDCE